MLRTLLKLPRRLMMTLLLISLTGCGGTKTVLVPDGDPVRLAEPAKAKVYVKQADGTEVKSKNSVVLPEGWYCVPPPRRAPKLIEAPPAVSPIPPPPAPAPIASIIETPASTTEPPKP
jgi:hypothetical protein